jgi:hypothetical protein
MLKKIIIGVVALLGLFLGYVATRPDRFVVERKHTMPVPADAVFARLNNFKKWEDWSPWAKIDPAMKATYDGPEAGVGAHYAWDGPEMGAGSMTIQTSVPNQRVELDLQFTKPFEARNPTTISLTPKDGGTEVLWHMEGDNNFIGKAMGVFMDMDKMVGGDFEKGLASLETVSKADVVARAAAPIP